MKKGAIVIDSWKLSIFETHLDEAMYKYTVHEGITADTLTINVETIDVNALAIVVKTANLAAAKSRMH